MENNIELIKEEPIESIQTEVVFESTFEDEPCESQTPLSEKDTIELLNLLGIAA